MNLDFDPPATNLCQAEGNAERSECVTDAGEASSLAATDF